MTLPIVNPTVEEEFDVIKFLINFHKDGELAASNVKMREKMITSLVEALNDALTDPQSLTALLSDEPVRRILEVTPLEFSLDEDGTKELEKPMNAGSGITAEMKRDDSDDGTCKSIYPVRFRFKDTSLSIRRRLSPGTIYSYARMF